MNKEIIVENIISFLLFVTLVVLLGLGLKLAPIASIVIYLMAGVFVVARGGIELVNILTRKIMKYFRGQ